MGTHPEIKDKALRAIFANELLALRRVSRQTGEPMRSDWMTGVCLGFETALRRVQHVGSTKIIYEIGTRHALIKRLEVGV